MKRTLALLLCFTTLSVSAQKDLIIFRDGTEKLVQITQVNSDKTLYLDGKGRKAVKQIADNGNIYMIKYEKRGNVYFSENGDRFTGDAVKKIPKNTVVLYLRKGQELLAYDFSMESRIVKFKENKKKKSAVRSLAKSDIFMIRYADGTKDVLIEYGNSAGTTQPEIMQEAPAVQQIVTQPVEERRTFPASATITLKKNNKVIECIIHSDNGVEIQYKRASNPDGPMYRQAKKGINKIVYNN